MALFLSTSINKIDSKGRVSVPAGWRTAIAEQGVDITSASNASRHGIFVYPSLEGATIEGGGAAWRDSIGIMLEEFDPFTQERALLNDAIFGRSEFLSFDGEGRVIPSPTLLDHAGIDKEICFVGLGERFQIWEPKAYTATRTDVQRSEAAKLLQGLTSPAKIKRGDTQ
ncbi:MAG: division/cell wall cluster transcriptional repressor MraZ [Alphaproteobacteria bacterium]|nr:division/cell wall cluster transcriptional repressor MraZ [Alphaproteobacteria bacterium]